MAVSAPPEAIAGLYLRETPRNHLAMVRGTPFDDARQDVEFGVVLEGDLAAGTEVEVGDSGEGEGVEGGGSVDGEGRDGEGAGPGLGGDEGIEMMELGGERKWGGGSGAAAVFLFGVCFVVARSVSSVWTTCMYCFFTLFPMRCFARPTYTARLLAIYFRLGEKLFQALGKSASNTVLIRCDPPYIFLPLFFLFHVGHCRIHSQ